jgi:hypothetical protein
MKKLYDYEVWKKKGDKLIKEKIKAPNRSSIKGKSIIHINFLGIIDNENGK